MKKLILIVNSLLPFLVVSQTGVLDTNSMLAHINVNGILCMQEFGPYEGYGIIDINRNLLNTMYGSTFWVGAIDQNGNPRVCANPPSLGAYLDRDFERGPVSNRYNSQAFLNKYDYVYTVTSDQVIEHQQNWNDPNYIIPHDILHWPGNGNVNYNEASILAPFTDYNNNSIYEPNLGDHPAIRGDKAMYFILNDDDGNHQFTGGDKLHMEYHFMIYQYAGQGFLDSTTFINMKIINRSQNTYDQLKVANVTNFEIGSWWLSGEDDYMGCSSDKNMIFGYNGDNFSLPFGTAPPACGVKLLNHNLYTSASYNYTIQGVSYSFPETAIWHSLNAQWHDNTPLTFGGSGYGGTTSTNFVFDGNPNDTSIWTEVSANRPPGLREGYMVSEPIDNFAPGHFICYDFAILYSRTGGNNLLNVNGLFDVADSVQGFYDTQSHYSCEPIFLNEEELLPVDNSFTIYPNPTSTQFYLLTDGSFNVEIYSTSGQLISQFNEISSKQKIPCPDQKGIYLVKVFQENEIITKKLVVE